MIVQILPVIDRSTLNFTNGFVYFVNGLLLLLLQFTAVGPLQVRPRMTQIRQRVQISRMLSRWRRLREAIARHKEKTPAQIIKEIQVRSRLDCYFCMMPCF